VEDKKQRLGDKVRSQANIDSIRERTHLTADDIAYLLSRSYTVAYKVLNDLNADLEREGYYTVKGRIPKKYFCDRFNIPYDSVS
jgi:conserved domain protein